VPSRNNKSIKISKKVLNLIAKMIVTLIVVTLFVLIVRSGGTEVPETVKQFSWNNEYKFSVPDYTYFLENEILNAMIDTRTLQFQVVDKRNNYIWKSVLSEEDPELNETWHMFFNSSISVEFFDSSNNVRRAYLIRDANISVKTLKKNKLTAQVYFEQIGASFDISYELVGDSLNVNLSNLKESDYKLISLYIYPYLGASSGILDGSFVLADGVGAKLDLAKPTVATAPLKMRMYGEDIGFKEVLPYSYFKSVKAGENYALPFYGILYNFSNSSNGLLTVIEEGDLYTEINAYKSGIVTNKNWITPRIVLRDLHKKLLNKAGEGITIPQESINTTSVSLRYFFLTNVNEYSLAQRFVDEYSRVYKKSVKPTVKFKFDILLAESKKSTFGYTIVKMTDQKQLEEMKRKIDGKIPESFFVLHGFSKGGLSLNSPEHLPFEKRVIEEIGFFSKDYFYVDYMLAPKESKSIKKAHIAQNKLEQFMEYENKYIVSPEYTRDVSITEIQKFARLGIKNIAFGGFGKIIFSTKDFSRAQTLTKLLEVLGRTNDSLVYGYNWPTVKYAKLISDVALTNSGYEIIDETVPIVPYVLRQFSQIFSKPLNLSSNYKRDLLLCVEYGILPSLYLTWNGSEQLIETNSRDLVSTRFEDWYDKILEARKVFESAAPFFSSRVLKRESVVKDVYIVSYENGTDVLFNYTDRPFKFNNITVEPNSFRVLAER